MARSAKPMKEIFNPGEFEARWSEKWEQDGIYEFQPTSDKPKY